jgi:hypothetical protein
MRVILGSWTSISVSTPHPIICRAAEESEDSREVTNDRFPFEFPTGLKSVSKKESDKIIKCSRQITLCVCVCVCVWV